MQAMDVKLLFWMAATALVIVLILIGVGAIANGF